MLQGDIHSYKNVIIISSARPYETERDRQTTDRQTDRQRKRQKEAETKTQRGGGEDRQTDRDTCRDTDGEGDRVCVRVGGGGVCG